MTFIDGFKITERHNDCKNKYSFKLVAQDDGSRGRTVFRGVCMFVYSHNISKIDAADLTQKCNVHHESWKPVRSEVKVTSNNKSVSVDTIRCDIDLRALKS